MSDITVDVLIIICGIVIAIAIVSAAFMKLRAAERRMHESSYKLKAYTDLLNAVTEINLACGDSYKMDIAKKDLALTLNRLNLIASSGVQERERPFGSFQREQGQGVRRAPAPQCPQYDCD